MHEHCGFENLSSQRVKFHPGIYESQSSKALSAIVSGMLGPEQQMKGIQVLFLNPDTGGKAAIKQPVKYAGFNIGSVIPLQKRDFSQDKQLLIGFDLESSLALAQTHPTATVLCARSLEGLNHFSFKGHKHDLNLCLNEPYLLRLAFIINLARFNLHFSAHISLDWHSMSNLTFKLLSK